MMTVVRTKPSNNVDKAMIIPMNPHGEYSGGSTPGSIAAQKWFSDKKGKVLISFDKRCRYVNLQKKPKIGFFYDSSIYEVTHRFSIDKILGDKEIHNSGVDKYLPAWRKELFEDSKRKSSKNRTWMVISKIRGLRRPMKLSDFGVNRCRSFVYTDKLPKFKLFYEKESPEKLVDDVIYRCLSSRSRFTEDDLELIMWALMVKKGAEYLNRQRSVKRGKFRLDMYVKTPEKKNLVIELKRNTASKDTLATQLRPYMNYLKEEENLTELEGIIIARKLDKDLERELEKPENSDIRFIPYKFNLESTIFTKLTSSNNRA